MILCLGTTPAAQRVMVFPALKLDAVNRAVQTLEGAAGKSVNVAKVLRVLGDDPLATGFLGGDRGEDLLTILRERGIRNEFVTVTAQTRLCLTVIDVSAGTHTELVEESRALAPTDYERLLEIVKREAPRSQAIVMSGTLTPGGPVDFYAQCVRQARVAGVPAVVDAQGVPLLESLAAGPDLVKPNRAELAASVGRALATESDVVRAMRELAERGARRVVVTDGARPCLACEGAAIWRIVSPRVVAANPIGSGDAFTAGTVSRLVRGDELGEACRWGAAAGTANALTLMAGEVDLADVQRLAFEVQVERVD